MHHAVEMILKGILAQKLSRDELLKLGHNLIRLWGAAKAIDNYQELTQFDDAIAKLHRFERIRYPDKLITEGATMQTGLRKGDEIIVSQPKSNPNTSYEMALEDIDHLVKVLFKLLGHNPLFYLNSFKQSARSILAEQNIHPFWQ